MNETLRGFAPYGAPYFGFLLLVELGRWLPAEAQAVLLVTKVALPALLLLGFAARGEFPELRGGWPGPGALADVALGLAVALLWVGPYLAFPVLPRPGPETGFDPGLLDGSRAWTLGVRLLGFALVTPFVEELFIRSWLPRYLHVFDGPGDFRQVPVAWFTRRMFWGTVLAFTVTHAPWEWPVAFTAGVLYTGWLAHRGHLGAVILAHAVTNAAIGWFVIWRAPSHPELWIFL